MKTAFKTIVIICIATMAMGLSPLPSAVGVESIPVQGYLTYIDVDFPPPYTAMHLTSEVDLNIGSVTIHDVLPISNITGKGTGTSHFYGSGEWDFGGGNTLLADFDGIWTLRSIYGIDSVHFTITGGTGIYAGADGSIHIWAYPAASEGQIAKVQGVIRVP